MTESTTSLTRESDRLLNNLCEPRVVKHSRAVAEYAVEIAQKLIDRGYDVDLQKVKSGALLHDIGRCRSHGIDHGLCGAKILKKKGFSDLEGFCLHHIGAGISKKEAEELDLPARNYFPSSLEEKIVAYADNRIRGDERIPLSDTIERIGKKLGKDHPAIRRIKELDEEINNLIEA